MGTGVPVAAKAAGLLADGLTGDGADVLAGNAEIGEFTVGHAAEFRDGLAILDPVVVSAGDVHVRFLSWELGPDDFRPEFDVPNIMLRRTIHQRVCGSAPMQILQIVLLSIRKYLQKVQT